VIYHFNADAPIIMSEPHFLEAPEFKDEMDGLKPDPEKHRTLIDVEPVSGTFFYILEEFPYGDHV